ncbi:MAG: L-serine ammonia-lyase, iron-sulfur-dependent, subunit alpha [Tepidanaerobacter acetatoxydans]|uniref:L-serine ammonia-lyase, iron-sulfur-dependent, subunit alpha n=1 Tax=Tepidanaerobacter acetatoxydans TaxID=499229 RepID=UPI0026F0D419|nr:L-serine ammonia-lyase, iron-sulfur-dependent, subunit alpha [Tepidanaerobacter acetatoxydans]NLU11065.1 L-serine ammonia-lyase, iron-sulfur-dependent, subunit alpha [Tepidanaerobacter acetatoxydans]
MSIRTLDEIIAEAETQKVSISTIIKIIESKELETSVENLTKKMKEYFQVMKESAQKGIERPISSLSGITGGEGYRLWKASENAISDNVTLKAAARAMAVSNVNASMGRIVASPTAGSCGIIPGVLISVAEKLGKSDDQITDVLFTAGAVGKIIAMNATLAGAEGGCQAECGSAVAMAAAATVELSGGTPRQVGHAVAIALKSLMGLVCDPVAGLVEVPCIKRNGMGAVQAIMAADMALAGIESIIPADEVIKAMGEVGRMMPEQLRETATGGLATTPTGKRIKRELFG